MAKCYLCNEDAIASCRKCAKPLCNIHNIVVHGSNWCRPCHLKESNKSRGKLMVIFGIIFMFFFTILLLPTMIYLIAIHNPDWRITGIILLVLALIMTLVAALLIIFGIKKYISKTNI